MRRRSFLRLLGLGAACAATGIRAPSLPAEPAYRAEPLEPPLAAFPPDRGEPQEYVFDDYRVERWQERDPMALFGVPGSRLNAEDA